MNNLKFIGNFEIRRETNNKEINVYVPEAKISKILRMYIFLFIWITIKKIQLSITKSPHSSTIYSLNYL